MVYRPCVPNCRECSAEIFFAWDRRFDRWVPVDLNCVRGDEQEYKHESGGYGVLRESHHLRHRCGFTSASPIDGPQPHRVLFVAADAPLEVIRAAYIALAKVYHPDSGGSVEAFLELKEAYEALLEQPRSPLR